MKSLFFLVLFIPVKLLAQNDSLAKNNLSVSIVLNNHLPVNYFKRTYSYGIGGAINVEWNISKSFGIILNPGYLRYFYNKKITSVSGSTGYVLLLAGARYYPVKKIYIQAEPGLGIKTSKFGKESAFAYSGGAGIFITRNLAFELAYSKGKGTTFAPENIALNAGYSFYRPRRDHRK